MKVGFIGLGAMGAPMARRVVRAGFEVYTTIHRRREAAEHLATLGAVIVDNPAGVARAADVIITILPADNELKETILGASEVIKGFAPGKILVDMTTGTAFGLQEVEKVLVADGGRVLDAPVSGGTSGEGDADFSAAAQFLADLANVKLAQPRQPGPTSETASTR